MHPLTVLHPKSCKMGARRGGFLRTPFRDTPQMHYLTKHAGPSPYEGSFSAFRHVRCQGA